MHGQSGIMKSLGIPHGSFVQSISGVAEMATISKWVNLEINFYYHFETRIIVQFIENDWGRSDGIG
jgi:hypothetical protein